MSKLTHALLFFAAAVSAVALFAVLKHKAGVEIVPEPWDKLLLGVITFASLGNLLTTAMNTGRKNVAIGEDGRRISQLKRGTRFLMIGTGAGGVLLGLGAILEDWPPSATQSLYMGGFAIGMLYCALWGLLARVEFDAYDLIATNGLFVEKSHKWKDIQGIDPEPSQTLLRFRHSGTAKISHFYEGKDQILARAKEALKNA